MKARSRRGAAHITFGATGLHSQNSQDMQQGKYYYIKSNLSGLVVEVEGGNVYPGVKLITMGQKQGQNAAAQLFYTEPSTGTIRSKVNDYCIDIMSDSMVLNPFMPGNGSQEWNLAGNFIMNRKNPSLAVDIAGNGRSPGSKLTIWTFQNQSKRSQNWTIEYQKAQYFQLKSELSGKVLDVRGSNKSPGTPVVMWTTPSGDQKVDNQLWYEDATGVLRSKLNNFALDASGGKIVMHPYSMQNLRQQWILQGNRVANRHNSGEVLDIIANNKDNGAELCAHGYKASGNQNQHWQAVYI